MTDESFDAQVRHLVYRRFVDRGRPPDVTEIARALSATEAGVEAALRRLEAGHALVLAPGTLYVWMANPFCATPTSFRVTTAGGSWWGTCVWDAFGIPAALDQDAVISTLCHDCNEPMEFQVTNGRLRDADAVAHFAVPARNWWDNIGYT